jgi:hypothetical protein
MDASGNCDLFYYDVTNPTAPQFMPFITTSAVTSSPGYDGDGEVVIAAEDGNVYSYYWASNNLAWTALSTTGNPIDSSPTTWPNLDGVYVIDNGYNTGGGVISKLDPGTGMPMWPPIYSSVYPGGVVPTSNPPTSASASSVAVSSSLSMLFAAGSDGGYYGNGIVQAYNSATGNQNPIWSNDNGSILNAVTSSPVVSDSQGLVYVQTSVSCGQYRNNGGWSGSLIYALNETGTHGGAVNWYASPPSDPNGFCTNSHGQSPTLSGSHLPPTLIGANVYSSGGSPAYEDDTTYGGPYVIAAASVSYDTTGGCYGCGSASQFLYSILAVYNAQSFSNGGGSLACSAQISHPITNSSPEVVNGVIFIGTDDGYLLAYDETNCATLGILSEIFGSPFGPMDSAVLSPPVVSFNRAHVVTQKGTLYVWGLLNY